MVYAGKFGHQLRGDDFHFPNFAPRLTLAVEIDVATNRVLDVCERLFDCGALRVTSRQFRTTDRHAFLMFQQGHMKFSFHKTSVSVARKAVNCVALLHGCG